MRRKNDILWKAVMEEVFDDLLKFVFPDADRVYDLERGFEFLEKELAEMYPGPDKDSDTRFVDKLVKVFHRSGEEEWVLMHIEIQGDTSKRADFPARMFKYFYRILDRFRRPVSAIAILTGRDAKKMPDRFEYAYRTTSLVYKYHTVSILDFKDEELEQSENPFALVVLAAKTAMLEGKIPEQELLERKLFIAGRLLRRGFPQMKVRAILKFLLNYVRFADPEMNRIFNDRIQSQEKNRFMSALDDFLKMEMEEGIEIGRETERRAIVLNLLSGTEFSDDKIASLANVTVDIVEEIRNSQANDRKMAG